MGRPTLVVGIEGDPTGGVQAFATEAEAAKSFASQMEAITKSIEVGFDNVQKKIEAVSRTQNAHASNTSTQLSSIQRGLEDVGNKFEKAFDIGTLMGEAASNVISIVGPLALVEGAIHLVEVAWDGLVELSEKGVAKGDEIRDLSLSFSVMDERVHGAGDALDYFEKHADDTRDTAEKLAEAMKRLEPLATGRGFSIPEQENITLMLSQLATIRGTSFDDMQGGWQALLSGRVMAGRNPLLAALGISKADVDHLGFDLVLEKMQEISSHFPEFGQSFHSELEKIKEDVVVNIAEGFNDARGSAKSGMDGIRAAVNDPELRDDLKALGGAIAGIFSVAGETAKLRQDLFTIPNFIRAGIAAAGGDLTAGSPQIVNDAYDAYAQRQVDQHRRDQQSAINRGIGALTNAGLFDDLFSGKVALDGLSSNYFEKTIGEAQSSMNKDQFKTYLAEIIKAAKDGKITLAEFTAAEQVAMAPPEAAGNHGLVDPTKAAKDAAEAARKALEAAKAKFEIDKQTLDLEQKMAETQLQLDAKVASAQMSLGSPFQSQMYVEDIRDAEQLLQLGTKRVTLEKEIADYGSVNDPQAKARVTAAKQELDAVDGAMNAEIDAHNKLKEIYADNYWKKFFDEGTQASYEATRAIDDFARGAEDEISQMAPAVALRVRTQIAEIRKNVQDELSEMQTFQLAAATMGVMPDDPVMKQFIGNWKQQILGNASFDENQALTIGKRVNDDASIATTRIADRFHTVFDGAVTEFTDLFENGGKNFGKNAAQTFQSLLGGFVQNGLGDLLQRQAGITFDPGKGYTFPGARGQYFATGEDALAHSPTGQNYATGLAYASLGISAAYGGYSGAPNAVTNSVMQGAVAGAALGAAKGAVFGLEGALVGAVVGFAAAEIGRLFSSKLEVGGIPRIDALGQADVIDPSKLDPAQIQQWRAQIQSTFNAIHDDIVHAFIAGGAKPPGTDVFTNISPGYDSRLSPDEISNWIQGQLGTQELGRVKDSIISIGQSLGFSAGRMTEIWTQLQTLDPKTAAADLVSLFTSVKQINDDEAWLHPSWSLPDGTKAGVFQAHSGETQSRSFTYDIDTKATEIEKFAGTINSLSIEGQISAFGELGTKLDDFKQSVQSALDVLFQTWQQETQKYKSNFETLDVQQFTRGDGSVDEYGLAQYYKQQAQTALTNLGNAKDPTQLQQYDDAFQRYIMLAEQAGIAQDPYNSQKWIDWARTQLQTGQGALDSRTADLGTAINNSVDAFNNKLDPVIKTLTTQFGSLGDAITGPGSNHSGGGDPGGNRGGGIVGKVNSLGDSSSSAAGDLDAFGTAVNGAVVDINDFRAALKGGKATSSPGDGSGTVVAFSAASSAPPSAYAAGSGDVVAAINAQTAAISAGNQLILAALEALAASNTDDAVNVAAVIASMRQAMLTAAQRSAAELQFITNRLR